MTYSRHYGKQTDSMATFAVSGTEIYVRSVVLGTLRSILFTVCVCVCVCSMCVCVQWVGVCVCVRARARALMGVFPMGTLSEGEAIN